jgi:hypothetical protein
MVYRTTMSERVGDSRVRFTQSRLPSIEAAKRFTTQREMMREEAWSLARLSLPIVRSSV